MGARVGGGGHMEVPIEEMHIKFRSRNLEGRGHEVYTLEDTIEVVLGNENMDLKPELNWFIVAKSVLKVPSSFLSYTCPSLIRDYRKRQKMYNIVIYNFYN
jgi:hypothetical protein